MKKRKILLLLLAFSVFIAAGCSSKSTASVRKEEQENIVEQIAQSSAQEQETEDLFVLPDPDAGKETEEEEPMGEPSPDVDVDLTVLNSAMVYAQVSDMMNNPDAYVGKTVRMQGTLAVTDYNGVTYFACFIKDAAQCCQQGIEFVRSGNYSWPEDYPEMNSEIMVEGTFTVYEDEGYLYASLFDATMTAL